MVSAIISRLIILVFGTLYPGYASYKAVKTKNVKEYVKWMMYWIVFALFTTAETFTDLLLSWLPFYYELKIVFVLWMLSPATKGSSILYRKFVHPQLMKREKDIDECIDKARTQGYSALVKLGSQGINMAIKTAITSQTKLVDQLKKSYSMGDISSAGRDGSEERDSDGVDNRFIEEELSLRREPIVEEETSEETSVKPVYSAMMAEDDYEDLDAPVGMTTSKSAASGLSTSTRPSTRSRDKNAGLRRAYSHKEAYHYATMPRQRNARHRSRQALPEEWTN